MTVRWLERVVSGRTYRVPFPPELYDSDASDYISPVMMGYLCRRLQINSADFGYDIQLDHGGFVEAPDDGSTWESHPIK